LPPVDWSSSGAPKKLVEYRRALIYDGQQGGGGIGAATAPEWEAEMEMRRAGKFQKVVSRERSLCLFTRAGARAPYLVCEIVQNGACEILLAARMILARLLARPKRVSAQ
jgi:hypothetical protein